MQTKWTVNAVDWTLDSVDREEAHELRREFCDYLRARASDDSQIDSAELAFGELLTNAIKHGCGPIEVRVEWNNGQPLLSVADRGPGFAMARWPPPDDLNEHGRGLFLASTLSTGLSVVNRPGGGTCVSTVLPAREAARPDDHIRTPYSSNLFAICHS